MKILFVITGLGLGGAEKQICLLADRFADLAHQVSIISLTGEAIIKPENNNIKIYSLGMKKTPYGFLSSVLKIKNVISKINPDVVHGHMFHANIMVRLAGLLLRRKYKLLCTAHSNNEGGKLRMLAYRLTNPLCDFNTNVSKQALDEFISQKSFSKSNSYVVYNGVDTDKFQFNNNSRSLLREKLGIGDNESLILTVGRLTPAKDYPNLLAAFCLLPNKYKLVIIGEGEVRASLENIIKEHSLASRVQLLGSINSVQDYYSACDLFVLSSAWEGFGLVVAEAMACQRIAVCTDAGGIKEVIGNIDFVVPISDPHALAHKILTIDELNAEQKNNIGFNNRDHIVKNFSINSVIDRWLSIYKREQVDK